MQSHGDLLNNWHNLGSFFEPDYSYKSRTNRTKYRDFMGPHVIPSGKFLIMATYLCHFFPGLWLKKWMQHTREEQATAFTRSCYFHQNDKKEDCNVVPQALPLLNTQVWHDPRTKGHGLVLHGTSLLSLFCLSDHWLMPLANSLWQYEQAT